ncbi:50S ribosomal protein L10 [Eubacteriales bacterium OttesenSCG-928-N14]|nr:50S ribosomal protein L10 [Eubacteriales bacterium OttesenSCG-928-N14]
MKEIVQKKAQQVEEIAEKLQKAKSAIFVDYRGLNAEQATTLRNNFRNAGVEFIVLKNTLIHRAAEKLDLADLYPYLSGPTAIAFGYDDPVAPAKVMADYIKQVQKTSFKCGLVEGKVVDEKGVQALVALPSREVLLSKMLGSMNAPITGLVTVLNGNIRALVTALDAIAKKKSA